MRVLVKVVDPAGVVLLARFDAMHLIALLQQKLRQVTAVLPRDAWIRQFLAGAWAWG